ncbi:MAG: RraA family protein [Chloroflexota bacterium]|nr:RraA family protein [Chloroflexota bacterium]
MIFNDPDRIAALTPHIPFGRLDDGRPATPEDLIERLKLVTNDEAWGVLEKQHDYHFQFEGNWMHLQPDVPLVGRAVTAAYVPHRPDLNETVQEIGTGEGRSGGQNTWIIDQLQPGDVLVIDLFGKIEDGTFIGDNLATAARARTGTGMVINGGIRDLARVEELTDFPVYCRGAHPTAIADVTLVQVNGPIRIGAATVLPGDTVLGTREGVTFVPPHLLQEVVEASEDTRQRDVFGKLRLAEGRYSSGDIDVSVWVDLIEVDYQEWLKASGEGRS